MRNRSGIFPLLISAIICSIWIIGFSCVSFADSSTDLSLSSADQSNNYIVSGVYSGIDWRITLDHVLILGKAGETQTYAPDSEFHPWYDYRDLVTSIRVDGNIKCVTQTDSLFRWMHRAETIDLTGLDTSKATSMIRMFCCCSSLRSVDLSGIETGKCTSFVDMFTDCYKLEELDLSGFDTSAATDMTQMFYNCYKLRKINMKGFDTSNVVNMHGMFTWTVIENLDLTSFDLSKVRNLSYMFYSCHSLKSVEMSGMDLSMAVDMTNMFGHCSSITYVGLKDIKTPNVITMKCMFDGCKNLVEADLASLDTSEVFEMDNMISSCKALKVIDMSGCDLSELTDADKLLSGTDPEELHTPVNLSVDIPLEYTMYDLQGNSYTVLPKNTSQSIMLLWVDPTSSEAGTSQLYPRRPRQNGGTDNSGKTNQGTTNQGTNNTGNNDSGNTTRVRMAQGLAFTAATVYKTTNSKKFNVGARGNITALTYKSSNTEIAVVDTKGNVTIKGPGTVHITVAAVPTSEYYGASGKVRIHVALAKPGLKAKKLRGGKVKLTWTKVKSADGYRVYVKGPGDKKFKLRLTKKSGVKSVTHKGLIKGKKYSYKVVAFKKVRGKTVTGKFSQVRTVKVRK